MDDLISKQDKRAVVNLIDNLNAVSFYEMNEHSKECYYDIRNAIIAMPEQEPKTGRWTSTLDKSHHWVVRCDKCGWIQETETNYCPDCGKRMVEPQESDHKCHTCKHYTSGENDGSCGSYICKGYSNWERRDKE